MYEWVLAVHIMAWTSWMAGLFYLPRLFVYHAERGGGSVHTAETLTVMAAKLMRLIMNPAMIATWITGLWLAFGFGLVDWASDGWMHAKLVLVLAMSGVHAMLSKHRKALAAGESGKSGRYFRILNEAPTLLFVAIVIMVIVRPF